MAKKLEVGDEERGRYVETISVFTRSVTVVSPSCVQIDDRPAEQIRTYLGATLKTLVHQMHHYLANGGELLRVDESCVDRRAKWEFHYDLLPEFGGQLIYVETRFFDAADLDDRFIFIVSVHPPNRSSWT